MRKSNSIYTILSGLPDFIKDQNIPLTESSTDENRAYAEAMEGVQRLIHKGDATRHPAPPKARSLSPGVNPLQLLEEAVRDKGKLDVTNMPEYMEGYAEGTSPVTLDKLKKGEFSIQKTLDLHGLTTPNARDVFEAFMADSIRNGLICVKIVHGRGLKSKREPVLKQNLKSWILRAINRKWVTAFSSAPMCDGGPGATYILLKKNPRKRRIHMLG